MIRPLLKPGTPLDLRFHRHGNPDLGRVDDLGTLEAARRHTEDRVRERVDVNHTARDVRIAAEARLPAGIAEPRPGARVYSAVLLRCKETSEHRANAQALKVI